MNKKRNVLEGRRYFDADDEESLCKFTRVKKRVTSGRWLMKRLLIIITVILKLNICIICYLARTLGPKTRRQPQTSTVPRRR